MIKIGDLIKQSRNIDHINIEFYGNVSKIEKIKPKSVGIEGLLNSELFEITYEPNLSDLDENEIEYLIRYQKTPFGKKMKFVFFSNDLENLIGAEII
jgi:hypothetical protein